MDETEHKSVNTNTVRTYLKQKVVNKTRRFNKWNTRVVHWVEYGDKQHKISDQDCGQGKIQNPLYKKNSRSLSSWAGSRWRLFPTRNANLCAYWNSDKKKNHDSENGVRLREIMMRAYTFNEVIMPNYSTPEVLFQIIKASKESDIELK